MMLLATGDCIAKHDNGRIVVTVPNGRDTIELALDYGQAVRLCEVTRLVTWEAIQRANREAPPEGEIIAFPREVPSLARRERRIAEIMRNASAVANLD